METLSDDRLARTSSTNSTSSSSRKSSTARRTRPRKAASNASLAKAAGTPSDDKSLTSFPSLSPSPEVSPIATLASEPDHPQTPSPASLHTPGLPDPPTLRKISKPPKSIVGSLLAATPTSSGRSALFDDTPRDAASVPGNLHHASHDSIERLVSRHGAVDLIKQLSADLAQRDAQMTALRRKAEERERLLRKMLQECEVSNLDIEKRLRGLERGPNNVGGDSDDSGRKRQSIGELDGVHPEDPIDAHVAQALAEQHDGERESMPQVEDDSSVTTFPTLGDNLSVTSGDFATTKQKDSKGWKSYVWSGSTNKMPSQTPSVTSNYDEESQSQPRSRASSGSRKALSGETFMPPPQTKPKGGIKRIDSEEEASVASSRRSSGSVASWALRLVAGNNQTRDGDKLASLRGRPTVNGQNSNSNSNRFTRTTSMESTKTTGSTPKPGGPRSRPSRASLGPNGTLKSLPPDSTRSKTSGLGSPAPMQRTPSNIGPVEMDMILPEESRPPTLMPLHNMSESAEFLTDRFGFIYDQKRKKRQAEAAGAAIQKTRPHAKSEVVGKARESLKTNLEEDQAGGGEAAARPPSIRSLDEETLKTKGWQDYLKTATFPTELLSHTPSAAPITVIDADDTPKASSQVTVSKSGSYPALSSNPEPAPSHETSAHAELARPSANGPTSPSSLLGSPQPDPVKVLLEQLTDLHDSLQRDKTVKWNDFLRKVRAERKRDGDAVAANEGRAKLAMPETLLTDGEIVGIAGAGNKGKVGRAKWKEFRNLVLSGIPVAYRAKIWAECSGAAAMRVPGYYEDLIANGVDDPTVVSQIQMDINRTLTDNIFFRKGPGVHKLNEVLVAYSRRNPSVGYCQGMNLITACLLLIMPTAEDAFWVLATMIETILPESYYDHSLLASRADQVVLRQYVSELLPKLSQHFDALGIELEALTFQWFLSVFTDCLSAEALFRVWDVVLCMHDGSTFLFQVALALLKLNEKSLIECDNPGAVYHYINQQMTNHAISIDGLIQASEALKKVVKRNDVEERRAKAMDREREIMKQREELRAGRLKKADEARSEAAVGDTAVQEQEQSGADQLPHQPQLTDMVVPQGVNITPPTPTTPETMASSVSFTSSKDTEDEDYEDDEMRAHTPMPIDEEVLWRA